MRIGFIITVLILFAACAQKPVDNKSSPPQEIGEAGHQNGSPAKSSSLDKDLVKKVEGTFTPTLANDDKKAKQSYGRTYRVMPEFMQFAFDMRFKNYDHALGILPKILWTDGERAFWENIVKKRPGQLAKAICENVGPDSPFSKYMEPSKDEQAWVESLNQLVTEMLPQDASKNIPQTNQSLDQEIAKLNCSKKVAADLNPCDPVPADLQPSLFTEDFFDRLHNMQRRDTRFVKENYRHPFKMVKYKRYVKVSNIVKLYNALKATEFAKQNHFLRRIKGVARDVRGESTVDRVMADIVLEDKKDMLIARQLQYLVQRNPTLSFLNHLNYGLALCKLSEDKALAHQGGPQ